MRLESGADERAVYRFIEYSLTRQGLHHRFEGVARQLRSQRRFGLGGTMANVHDGRVAGTPFMQQSRHIGLRLRIVTLAQGRRVKALLYVDD